MATPAIWIRAARPRTLPLALSGVLMGCGLALSTLAFTLLFCIGSVMAKA